MSIINSKIPILDNEQLFYSAIFYEKKYYCLSESANSIDIYNETFQFISKVKLEQYCDNMTFCYQKKLFYLHKKNSNTIIVTDINFKIVKQINYPIRENIIISMCYAETENMLYLITSNFIITINSYGKMKKIVSKYQINKKIMNTNTHTNFSTKLISNLTTAAIIQEELYISYYKNNQSYLAIIKNGEIIEEQFIDTDCYVHNIINCDNTIQLLVGKKYNYIYETNIYLKESEESENKLEENSHHIETNQYNVYYKEKYSNCYKYEEIESIVQEQIRY